ncbi:gallate 1-beta-glucosyltransferase 84A24-like [Salvia miltiorrhiza]|uniref:gallate 1-beta-glucosyltransferase 84A24-like n=1 Tax=Salvia miltiorrhiza TaxID=226208 RepID=UPI0025AB8BB4|nr:gallate 1-beta-glucosyltransferase 84A24-like [Salvia miltiorrhiza]
MSGNGENIHAFMVSFPAQGHVNPLLRLGRRLANFGAAVTFCAPEAAGASIRKASKISDAEQPTPCGAGSIRFEFFDDGWDFDNPNRDDICAYLAQLEAVGREKLPQLIGKEAELGRPVSCVINNPFIPWVCDVAKTLGIPSAMLWVQSCACFSAYYHYYHGVVPFPTEQHPETDVQLPCLPLLKHDEFPDFLHPRTPYVVLRDVILGQFRNLSIPFCVFMDTFQELEHENIQYMSGLIGRPIKTVGPLFKELERHAGAASQSQSKAFRADFFAAEDCVGWLDSKPPRSVVYISFGSIVHLPQEQVDEIANGLADSWVAFLWVVRPPPREKNWKAHVLPEGFVDRVGERGRIVQWSPQEEVLAHPSTACFMTHCGWNSTMEALASGVPVVAFPQWGDQVTNAKFLVDVYKVGVRMCRGEAEGRLVPRDEVATVLEAAVTGPRAEEMRTNALNWKKAAEAAVAEGGSSYRNMQYFVDEVARFSDKLK